MPHTEESSGDTWEADLAFARGFLAWNGASRAVVRVDGVRETSSGQVRVRVRVRVRIALL